METVNVTIRMDRQLKKDFEALVNELGMSMNAAITVFAKQAVREQRIPFEITKKTNLEIVDESELEKIADEELALHLEAYKELAK